MSNIEKPVANLLVAKGLVIENVDMFVGLERPKSSHIPSDCTFIFQSGGFMPEHYMGCGGSHREVFIHVFVRGEPSSRSATLTKALAIFDTLDRAEYLVGVDGFICMDAQESNPTYFGRNKDNEHIYYAQFVVGYTHTKV